MKGSKIMSHDKSGSEGSSPDPAGSPCRLAALRKRSQVDFEIDFFERILSRDPNYTDVLANLGELFSKKKWHRRALQVDQRLSELRPLDPVVLYNLACSHAALRAFDDAVATLRRAIAAGYNDFDHMLADRDLDALREHPEYLRLMQDLVQSADLSFDDLS